MKKMIVILFIISSLYSCKEAKTEACDTNFDINLYRIYISESNVREASSKGNVFKNYYAHDVVIENVKTPCFSYIDYIKIMRAYIDTVNERYLPISCLMFFTDSPHKDRGPVNPVNGYHDFIIGFSFEKESCPTSEYPIISSIHLRKE